MSTCQQQQQFLHPGGYDLPSVYSGTALLPLQGGFAPEPPPPPSSLSGRSATDQVTAMRIHSEAERRRRERINAHLDTLRRILPDAKQMDKATLLATVVSQVKHLKKFATHASTASASPIPPEANEVAVQCHYTGDDDPSNTCRTVYVHATVGCDDRPGLLADIAGAFRRLRLRPLSADMSCLGGRTRHVFVLCREGEELVEVRHLKESVRQALAKVAFPEMMYSSSSRSSRSKRQRVLESRFSTTVVYSHGW
uniref:BHLH domain-containing protein n=1 Tax=Leersia perrieri TaxID=77586 RepID=A0A0D9WD68_9ORYZ